MSGSDLYLEGLEIHRMPGFPPTRAFDIEPLSPGINVIHGPNASGKTTLAEAISIVLHGAPGIEGPPELRARARTGDGLCEIRVEAGQRTVLKNGEPDAELDLPAGATADRYRLWLHELLRAEDPNRSFAEQILQESRGGYDIASARDELGFRPSPSGRNIGERQDYRARQEELSKLHRKLKDPAATERRLERLKQEREKLQRDRERANALEEATTYRTHQDALDTAERKLAALPDALERVTGDESDRLVDLRGSRDQVEEEARDAHKKIEEAKQLLEDVDLPDEDPLDDLVPTLRQRVQRLQRYEDQTDQLKRELRGAENLREEARSALGEDPDPQALEEVDTELVRRADRVARDAETVHQKQAILEAVEEWLSEEEPPLDSEAIAEGIRALRRWLQQPQGSTSRWIPLAGGILTATAGAGGIGLGFLGAGTEIAGVVGLVLLLAALVLLYLAWQKRAGTDEADARRTYERDFERTDLEPPPAWDREAVEDRLDQLHDQFVRAKLAAERQKHRLRLAPDREALRAEREDVDAWMEELLDSFAIDLDLDERSFLWFVRQLLDWQEASTERARVQGELEEALAQRNSLVERITDDLAPYGYEAFDDVEAAWARAEDLEGRFQKFRNATSQLEQAKAKESEAREDAKGRKQEIRGLFEELDLEPGDEADLQRLCDRLDDYEDAVEERSDARPLRDQAVEDLRGMPGYEERMEEMSEAEIEAELDDLAPGLDRLEDLQDEIPTLEGEIRTAKKGEEVETALEARDQALAQLRDKMEEDTAKVVGWVVAEHVRERTRDQDLPAVFHRARELLATFTRGRYRLRFSNSDPPAFRARDTWHDETKALDELSSGTRVQLLLAVRLAFVEQQEYGPKLPLLLDETLANTDDVRARAIIEAVVEIARQGRQVFYLTAQKDEVDKWRFVLESGERSPPSYEVLDLAEHRSLGRERDAPAIELPDTPFEAVPPPDDRSHEEYGQTLDVPPFDLAWDIGAIHLWYLVEDTDLLHTLLDIGIERWGQLETLRAESGELTSVVPEKPWIRIRARAKALAAYRSAWSVGRGTSVDRAVLEETPGVTSTKIKEVAEVAEAVDGDPEQLLKALDDGEVSYFRDSQYEKLESYLRRQGYVDERSRLSAEEIQQRTFAGVAREIEAGILDREEVQALLDRLAEGP